ncbi:MAG: SDR family NAD(P)-dependent oxidoreductase [Pseudomonadota bacterium]
MKKPVCAVLGIGPKNGQAFARAFHEQGYRLALLSRSTDLSGNLAAELGDTVAIACDAADPNSVREAFAKIQVELGPVDVLIYNAGSGSWRNVEEVTVEDFERGFRINALGALVASQAVIPDMIANGRGNIVFVGATASLRGVPMTAGFAPAKAAQRILAQSMAKHLAPKGIHVSVIIVDGQIGDPESAEVLDGTRLDPRDIAQTAIGLTEQSQSAWSFEVDLRPKKEKW